MDSNAPHIDLAASLDPLSIEWWLSYQYAEHEAAINALLERFVAFTDVTREGIGDDFIAGHAADFARDLKAAANALDEKRTKIKKPVLHAQRMIDGFAKKLSDRVMAAVAEVEARVTAYLRLKEAEVRRAAEAEAARMAAEAERLAAEALRVDGMITAETAIEAFETAQQATELANARALELTRTRGLGGALTALVDRWTYEVVDMAVMPRGYLMPNDAAIRGSIKAGVRDIPGLRIFNDSKAMIR